MRIGVPKERKSGEHRVGLTPAAVAELTRAGHEVFVQTGAGAQIGFSDADYLSAGARLSETLEDIYRSAQLLVKVKEPMPEECDLLNSSHILFTFLHLAADSPLVARLQASLASCIAYETVTDEAGRLPLLAPMSEVAGRLAVQAGAHHLEIAQGGRGVLMGGVPGVPPAHVLPGSVLVDVAIDQGGCFATSRPTTHQQPTYVVNGVIHYCVTNIPSAAARTATMALTHASLPYVQALAAEGMSALNHNRQLLAGLNLYRGQITLRAVADSVGGDWHRAESLLPFPA